MKKGTQGNACCLRCQDSTELIIIITTKTPGIAPPSVSQSVGIPQFTPSREEESSSAAAAERTCVCDVSPIYFRLPHRAPHTALFTRRDTNQCAVVFSSKAEIVHAFPAIESESNTTTATSDSIQQLHERRGNRPPSSDDDGGKMWWKSEKSHYFLVLVEDGCLKIDAQAEGQELNLNSATADAEAVADAALGSQRIAVVSFN